MVSKGIWVDGDREGDLARLNLHRPVDLGDGQLSIVTGVLVGWWRDSSGNPSAVVLGEEKRLVIPWSNVASISDPTDEEVADAARLRKS